MVDDQLTDASLWHLSPNDFVEWMGPPEFARFCEFVRQRGMNKGKVYPTPPSKPLNPGELAPAGGMRRSTTLGL
jgi:hypothetical protein